MVPADGASSRARLDATKNPVPTASAAAPTPIDDQAHESFHQRGRSFAATGTDADLTGGDAGGAGATDVERSGPQRPSARRGARIWIGGGVCSKNLADRGR